MDLEQLYQQVILDHYRNPHGKGLRDPFDAEVHHVNPTCGDEITLRLRLGADGTDATDQAALAEAPSHLGSSSELARKRPSQAPLIQAIERVADVSYDSQGCSISQASASVMFDQVEGQPLTRAIEIGEEFAALMRSATDDVAIDEDVLGDGIAFSGVARYPARIKCALLPWMAFRDAAVRASEARDPQPGSRHDAARYPQPEKSYRPAPGGQR